MAAAPDRPGIIERLFARIEDRKAADPAKSYTASLIDKGTDHAARRMSEEAVETLVAAVQGDRGALVRESADLLYHLLVLWAAAGIEPSQVGAELKAREGKSGRAEKADRAAPAAGNFAAEPDVE